MWAPVRVAHLNSEPELVHVPSCPFLMGSNDKDRKVASVEKPQHAVALPAYEVGRYPVTNAEHTALSLLPAKIPPRTGPRAHFQRG